MANQYKIKGGVPVIGTLTRSVDSQFPIVIADDIELTDGTNLNDIVEEIREALFGGGSTPLSEIDDSVKALDSTWSSTKISNVISDLKAEIPTFDTIYQKDELYNRAETEELISSMVANALSGYATQSDLSASIQNGISNAVDSANAYTDGKIAETNSRVAALEELVGDGFEAIDEDWIVSCFNDEP